MVYIKIRTTAGEAKSGPPLAPILGQHQVNLVEFCKVFNLGSLQKYQPGIPLRVALVKSTGQPVRHDIKNVSTYSLIKNFTIYSNNSANVITLCQAYDIFCFVCLEKEKILTLSASEALARTMFGHLTSYGLLKGHSA